MTCLIAGLPSGSFIELEHTVSVEDGRLTLEIGGGGGNTCLNYVTVEPVPEVSSAPGMPRRPIAPEPKRGAARVR